MINIALISKIKGTIGDNVIAHIKKGKTYLLEVTVEGDPWVQFHLQDELTGKFILCINHIPDMTTGKYKYRFVAPDDSLLVFSARRIDISNITVNGVYSEED